MPVILLAIICGVLAVGFLPALPSLYWLLIIPPFVLVRLMKNFRPLFKYAFDLLLALAVGLGWGVINGHQLLQSQLPETLVGQDLLVTGRITDLPVGDEGRQRFLLELESMKTLAQQDVDFPQGEAPEKLQITWYQNGYSRHKPATSGSSLSTSVGTSVSPTPVSGERWQLVVRLKKPRGFVNPGGFDYQAWLLRRDIGGVGYVRTSAFNQKLTNASYWDISAWRYQLKRWLLGASQSPERGIMLALLIGDRSLIEPEQWRVMQLTGINHLISISGLHVGFLAILGFAIGLHLGRWANLLWHRCPALLPAHACAMLFALIYSALAGFNIPTQRTMIMVLAIQLAFLLRRSYRAGHVLLLALLLVVLHDPLAAYDIGFWLSFGAVAVLLFSFTGRYGPHPAAGWTGVRVRAMDLLRSQWVIFVGLLLPLSVLISSTSLLAPLANVLAIPLVTFLVVPALLLAAACHGLLPGLSHLLLIAVDKCLVWLGHWLEFLLDMGGNYANPVISFHPWALALAAMGVTILLLPKGLAGRWLGYLAVMAALVIPGSPPADLRMTVLDVGQGLAVHIQTPNHNLIYDAGPAYSENFEAGSAIVTPFLRQQGISQVDKLILSHSDNDHAGGLTGVLQGLEVLELLAGEASATPRIADYPITARDCHEYLPWQWDQVTFRFLHSPETMRNHPNNRSCILLVEYAGHSILLPGDIEARVENHLVNSAQLPTPLTVVLASHHGSRSSSSEQFVSYTRPELVVYSAGFRSQHGHPHPDVQARYAAIGSRALNTAESGALTFIWKQGVLQPVIQSRQSERRYWFDSGFGIGLDKAAAN